MVKYCAHCSQAFKALRKDKCFCSHSCRQMAFVKRQQAAFFLFSKRQNVNVKEHKIDASLDVLKEKQSKNTAGIDDLSTPLDVSEMRGSDSRLKDIDAAAEKRKIMTLEEIGADNSSPIKVKNKKAVYQKVHSSLLSSLHWDIAYRGHEEGFLHILSTYGSKASEVRWVSENYYCIIRCLLLLHEQRKVFWDDLAEISNALTFLSKTEEFHLLPDNYPYTKEILTLKQRLKALCLSTKGEEKINLLFHYETRYFLLLEQKELSVFPKITFNQLVQRFTCRSKKHEGY